MIPEIETYIYDRLIAQTTLTNIIGTRLTNIYGSKATLETPYVVYEVGDSQEQDTMRGDGVELTITFHIVDRADGNTNANCHTIRQQILGDGATQSNKQPTYGLHRLVVGELPSGWEAGQFYRTGGSTAHELNFLHYIETYKITGSLGT